MGIVPALASRLGWVFAAVLALGSSQSAQAAYYDPHYWYLTANLSYDSISPSEINSYIGDIGPLSGLIGFRLAGERGLVSPNWTHWFELGFLTGSESGQDTHPISGKLLKNDHTLRYWSVIPLGASYWFLRTSWVDFAVSLGLGLGLAPSYTLTQTINSNPPVTSNWSGTTAPLIDSRLTARIWASRYIGINGSLGFKYFGTTLTSSAGTTLHTNSIALSMIVGVTYAIGGVRGTGRNYVEVIKPEPKPSPSPSPSPTGAATPAAQPGTKQSTTSAKNPAIR